MERPLLRISRRRFIKSGAGVGLAAGCLGLAGARYALAGVETPLPGKQSAKDDNLEKYLNALVRDAPRLQKEISSAKKDLPTYLRDRFTLQPWQEAYFRRSYLRDKNTWDEFFGWFLETSLQIDTTKARPDDPRIIYLTMDPSAGGSLCKEGGSVVYQEGTEGQCSMLGVQVQLGCCSIGVTFICLS